MLAHEAGVRTYTKPLQHKGPAAQPSSGPFDPGASPSKIDQDYGCLRKAELSRIESQLVFVSRAFRPTLRACPEGNRPRILAPAARAGWVGVEAICRQREASTISCPGRRQIRFGCTTGAQTQIEKTTPCKVEWALLAAFMPLASGARDGRLSRPNSTSSSSAAPR